jgi:antitoxin component of MazEF toxin-antitoxin module
MFTLKLRKIESSAGFILPKEMLRHLHAKEGQEIFAIETPTGYAIAALDPHAQQQIKAGEAFMESY